MIEDSLERDRFLTAEQAREFGLVDKVIEKRSEEPTAKTPQQQKPDTTWVPPASALTTSGRANMSANGTYVPHPGRKFRFRAGLAAWQSRNARGISAAVARN